MVKRIALGVFALVILAYGGLVAYLYFNQRAYFFFPDGEVIDLAEIGFEAEPVRFPTADGESLNGWYAEPAPGFPVIVYYKGNSGSFSAEYSRYLAFQRDGYGVLAFDYRGFPASPGEITEANILADSLAAFDWLAAHDVPIVIWGRSLGAAPAAYVASQRNAEALLLETPFYSAAAVAMERYPFIPIDLLMLDPFRTHEWVGGIEEPTMVAHGTADTTISVGNGERLYAELPRPGGLWIVEGAGHSDLWDAGLWERAQAFFATYAAP